MLRSDGLRKVKTATCGSETICVKVAVFKNIDPVTLAAERYIIDLKIIIFHHVQRYYCMLYQL